ncbi:putative dirigent protein [Helianthus debilis subsp. tardiflorus]
MAPLQTFTLFSLYLSLVSTIAITANGSFSQHFATTKLTPNAQKMTRLHFYFHDIVSGKHPTAIAIIRPKSAFGMTAIVDDPLTLDTKPRSKVVGRAQGLYALASKHNKALLMAMNFAFSYGKYNGSTLSVLGRNPVLDAVREMPVIGGSGVFRFARGYALANTVRFNLRNGDAVVRYNATIMHG